MFFSFYYSFHRHGRHLYSYFVFPLLFYSCIISNSFTLIFYSISLRGASQFCFSHSLPPTHSCIILSCLFLLHFHFFLLFLSLILLHHYISTPSHSSLSPPSPPPLSTAFVSSPPSRFIGPRKLLKIYRTLCSTAIFLC